MRIALISDIHGNLVSLDRVLANIDRQHMDQIICLGDVATMGPQPCETIDRVRSLGCPCILGNHDIYLLKSQQYLDDPNTPLWLKDMISWCIEQLTQEDLEFLGTFQPTLETPFGREETLLCVHGSPRSAFDFLLAQLPPDDLDAMLENHHPTIMACGHTHVQMLRQHNGMLIVNVGSVGSPFLKMPFTGKATYMPWAEYGILDTSGEMISVELKRLPMDIEAIKKPALGNPHIQAWTDSWLH